MNSINLHHRHQDTNNHQHTFVSFLPENDHYDHDRIEFSDFNIQEPWKQLQLDDHDNIDKYLGVIKPFPTPDLRGMNPNMNSSFLEPPLFDLDVNSTLDNMENQDIDVFLTDSQHEDNQDTQMEISKIGIFKAKPLLKPPKNSHRQWTLTEKNDITQLAQKMVEDGKFSVKQLGKIYSKQNPKRSPQASAFMINEMLKLGELVIENIQRKEKNDPRVWRDEEYELLKTIMKNNKRAIQSKIVELFQTQSQGPKRGHGAVMRQIWRINRNLV